ncbi:exodeoxyribonuclease V subunit beta [soil metagenome]
MSPFDIADPLPTGRVTLEASAGTGKTYSIVGLAARYLAEGRCTAAQLLVVTFARSATRELRSRLLERLDGALTVVTAACGGVPPDPGDAVAVALCNADAAELIRRRDRLADALADIDQATVTTIHAFCAEALDRLGAGVRGTLLEDEPRFATQIAADLYLRAVQQQPDAASLLPYFDFDAPGLARAGLTTDPADVVPAASLASKDGTRAWLVAQAHLEGRRRKQRIRLHTHDDLLRRLADRLADHAHGADAALRAGGHYRVALIDEFQDTDPVQWRILSTLFPDASGSDGRALVLVGDPKQAIYTFRGADVHAYVAARGAEPGRTLDVNRRSDDKVVEGVLALFTGQSLGRGIGVPAVTADAGTRLQGLDAPPITIALVPDDAPVRRTQAGNMQMTSVRDAVACDVARQTVDILQSGATLTTDGGTRPVAPDDIAVLVRTRSQAARVQRHLIAAGVPSVLNGVGNVLASPAARDWTHVLRALDRPSQAGPARLAALSDLVGWSPARVARAEDEDGDDLHITLHGWRQVLLRDGVAAAFRRMGSDTDLAARLLSRTDGDRRLTDLTHLAELLHAHHSGQVVGTTGLVSWLELGMADAADPSRPVPPDHLASRLERGGDAVQIMTVHGAKGLEFGIVLAPYLWDAVGRNPAVMPFHDHSTGRRKLYVGSDRRAPDHDHHKALFTQEQDDEERRLAYVAATRARHHLRLWFAPAPCAAESPLGTLLARSSQVHTTAQATAALAGLQAAHPSLFGTVEVDVEAPVPTARLQGQPPREVALAPFDRTIDAGWRRTSYSRLVGDAHAAADVTIGGGGDVDTSPPAVPAEDVGPDGAAPPDAADHDVPSAVVAPPDPALDAVVPLSGLRGGADIGTTVHAVLEHVDFADADLSSAMAAHVARQAVRHAVDLGDEAGQAAVADGLVQALRTPLAPGGPALVDIARDGRIDEMAFEVPVLTEALDGQADRVLLADIADLLEVHLPADDPLADYAAVLRRSLGDVEIRGFLAGFIDLLARVPGTDRYLVADYKTNRMVPAGTDDVTVGHFTTATMAAEMQHHHYPLQAMVYLVATHRYLRWRIPGYDPARHLDGVAYLFLRGMIGPDTPVRDGMTCGVFRWRPPTTLVLALDGLLAVGLDPAERAAGGAGPMEEPRP